MNEQKQNQLFVFKSQPKTAVNYFNYEPSLSSNRELDHFTGGSDEETTEEFVLYKRIVVKDIPIFNKVCMQYIFMKK